MIVLQNLQRKTWINEVLPIVAKAMLHEGFTVKKQEIKENKSLETVERHVINTLVYT